MKPRWAEPVVPLAIEPVASEGLWLPDGRVHGQVQFTLKAEDIERMRTGYVCAKCLQVFEVAWPERCEVCGAPIRRDQAEYFAREFDSQTVRLGPSTSLEYELGMLEEHRRKEEEQKGREVP